MGIISSNNILALDSNIFIAASDETNIHHAECLKIMLEINKTHPRVFISVLVFEEFLVKIYEKNLENDLAGYEEFLTGGGLFAIVNLDRQIARKAAQIRAQYQNVKTP